jgi:antitoxin (DNA-binding transcriptional repressor) of toxin-antitoxin stability system
MDFDVTAARGHLIRQEEKAARDAKTEFAIDEFEDNFDELFARVEAGETLTIVHPDGFKVCMVPIEQWTGSTQKNDSNSVQSA